MTDDIITISAGAPPTDLTPGVYEVTLTDISEPRTIYPQTGINAGKEVQLRDWTFALEDGTEVTGSASTSSGPKSKTYAWLTALLGGTPPAVGPELPEVPAHRPRGARDDRDRRGRLGEDRQPLGAAEGAGCGPGRATGCSGTGRCARVCSGAAGRGRAAGPAGPGRRRPALLTDVRGDPAMSTWCDQYGVEPTRDLAQVRAWARAGWDLAVALNDLPADGPCHPATLFFDPLVLELVCETTGRTLVLPRAGAGPAQLDRIAQTARGWGCTYLVLTEGRR